MSDVRDNNPLLTNRMFGSYGLLGISGIGAGLMIGGIFLFGAGLCILGALGIGYLFWNELKNIRVMIQMNDGFRHLTTELCGGLVLILISLGLPVVVFMYLGSPSEIAALKAQVNEYTRLRWMPLTADEIVAIKHPVAGTRPVQPTMHIQYLDANAYDLAVSFKKLFTEIGFNPIIQLDTRVSTVGTIILDADDNDAKLVRNVINSIETVTKDRIKCELRVSKGQGQTRIFIGQKDTGQ